MSNINPIATSQIATGSQPQALQGSSTGVLSVAGGMANFWDMIVAQFDKGLHTNINTTAMTGAKAPVVTQDAAMEIAASPEFVMPARPKDYNPLAMLQVALSSQTIDAQGNIVLNAEGAAPEKIQSQLDFTNQVINKLKNILPESSEKEGIVASILEKLQAKSDTLQASLSALEGGTISKDTPIEDIPLPMLIALGLNPTEITEVSQKIQDMQKKLGREITVEDLIAGVGGLMPPAPETAVVAFAGASVTKEIEPLSTDAPADLIDAATSGGALPTDDLAAQLNGLTVGGEEATQDAPISAGLPKKKMEGLPVSDDADAAKTPDAAIDLQPKKPENNIKEHMVNLMNSDKSASGEMVFPVQLFNGDADAAIFQQYGLSSSTSLSLGTTAQAANTIATSASAGQSHPATGMVAAQITKFAANGGDQTMNIRLDPPELGNVSVRLQISKDKSVKAHLTVEKPETYLMLQRDSHALERALQQAGLEANAESISFELAQDNGTFAQDNNGQGAGNENFGGNASATIEADAGEIIQSSVMWQVDPSTGHVRYNIFA
jgi:flagellar hook-length control protein FliK